MTRGEIEGVALNYIVARQGSTAAKEIIVSG